MHRRSLLLFAAALAACSTKLGKDGRPTTDIHPRYLAKTAVDRMADAVRREAVEGLLLIADKLYKRNPREWRKSAQASREAAVSRLRRFKADNWPELGSLTERHAAALAFNEAYEGDRVAALMAGLLTMVDTAFGGTEDFYLFDSLDENRLYNCARNMEVAIWKLGNDRTRTGQPFLLANELDPANRNLSFEREFGRVMGLLDFMAKVVADRNGRTLSQVTQSVVTSLFLPVGF